MRYTFGWFINAIKLETVVEQSYFEHETHEKSGGVWSVFIPLAIYSAVCFSIIGYACVQFKEYLSQRAYRKKHKYSECKSILVHIDKWVNGLFQQFMKTSRQHRLLLNLILVQNQKLRKVNINLLQCLRSLFMIYY